MKVPFISKTTNVKNIINNKSSQATKTCINTFPEKREIVKSNLYRRFINFIDNLKNSTLPEDTKNIDSLF